MEIEDIERLVGGLAGAPMRGPAVLGYQLMSNSLPSGSFIATA
jgi:hypothetical protein